MAAAEGEHERDVHVKYTEHQAQQLEGDNIDTRHRRKVALDVHSVTDNEVALTVTFAHEDHTLGNILRHTLMQMPEVSAAGYSIPHPLDPKMVMHLQSTGKHAFDCLTDAIEDVATLCDKTADAVDAAL